jgi:DNA-binding transcriptional regulator YdaS (Cro superfamily)
VPIVLISQWANRVRQIPIERCPAIERATGGAVTRRDLRPDDWHVIWPELAEREPSPELPPPPTVGKAASEPAGAREATE